MSNHHDDDFDLDELFRELNEELSKDHQEPEKTKETFEEKFNNQKNTSSPDDSPIIWDKETAFREKILPLLEQVREIASDEEMDFFFSIKIAEREIGYDLTSTGFMVNPENKTEKHNPVCEFLAMLMLLEMPHDFSHNVINHALSVQASMGLMKEFEKFLRRHKNDDDDE